MPDLVTKPFKCLSVAQPWAWAIFHGKDFENRTWHSRSFSGPLLIHASQSEKFKDGWQTLVDRGHNPPPFPSLYKGFIIGIVQHVGCWHWNHRRLIPKHIPLTPFAEEGMYLHTYQHQTMFDRPIQYRGDRGLFDVPIDVVREQLNKLPIDKKRYFRVLYDRWCEAYP